MEVAAPVAASIIPSINGPRVEVGPGFDAGNRVTGITDSITGTISRNYDGLNHLLSETTPQGLVTYTYDGDGRRQTMTVSGQVPVNYTYDNANHLTAIIQGTANVSFTYDGEGKRTSSSLPNGVMANYSFDAASQLTGISYQGGALGVSNLAYAYDLDGRRTGVSGSLATTQLPAAVPSAVYNANNQLVRWGSTAMTYDRNGNTLNDGTNSYVWDARNRLVSADNNAATFAYDPLGRRTGKTFLTSATNYLYDGANAVQELNGTTPTANLLTGGMDERFTRTDATGTYNFLTDGLGSTVALTDSTGISQTQYSYDPYGSLSISGAYSTNSYTYTGREIDGLGIDYYRARYYNPATGRFLSEDPVGFRGGINVYAYVLDSPTNIIDPSGKCPMCVVMGAGAIVGAGNNLAQGYLQGDTGWKLFQDGLNGAAGGAVGALVGTFGGPVLGGAAGSLINDEINSALLDMEGRADDAPSASDMFTNALTAGLFGGVLGHTLPEADPWIPRDFSGGSAAGVAGLNGLGGMGAACFIEGNCQPKDTSGKKDK